MFYLVLVLCEDIQNLNKLYSLQCIPVFLAQYLLLIVSLHWYFETPLLILVSVSHMYVNEMG